jgi:glycolate oxidase iron-sulfur subunit
MCLPACPTYALTGLEVSSPRGRIRLMKSVAEDKLPLSNQFIDEMYFCLDCQACETICPAGVHYGSLVENARQVIAERGKDPFALRLLKGVLLNGVLVSRRRLRLVARIMWIYEQSGLREAVERSRILSLFSLRIEEKHAMLPRFSSRPFDESVEEVLPSTTGKRKGRVAFLSGCIMNVTRPEVHRDAIEVLRASGFEVVVPKLQECCGSLHGHNGEIEAARALARKNLDVFERDDFDYFIVDSAGCGAFLKDYGVLLAADDRYAENAAAFSMRVKDITEFLAGIELPPLRAISGRVTYHDACHLVHTQKIGAQPRKLIQSIPDIKFVELPESTWCCGSAGIYNMVRFDDSMKLLEQKMKNIASTGAEIVVTANPGCHLQLEYGIRNFGLRMEVMHPVQLLMRAYGSFLSETGIERPL